MIIRTIKIKKQGGNFIATPAQLHTVRGTFVKFEPENSDVQLRFSESNDLFVPQLPAHVDVFRSGNNPSGVMFLVNPAGKFQGDSITVPYEITDVGQAATAGGDPDIIIEEC